MADLSPKYSSDAHSINFSFEDEYKFEEYVGWVKYVTLGFADERPAFKVETCYVHHDMHNSTNAGTAVERILKKFEDQKILDKVKFIYPENYKDLTDNRSFAALYVIADKKEDLTEALECFPSSAAHNISQAIKHDVLDSRIRGWKLYAA